MRSFLWNLFLILIFCNTCNLLSHRIVSSCTYECRGPCECQSGNACLRTKCTNITELEANTDPCTREPVKWN